MTLFQAGNGRMAIHRDCEAIMRIRRRLMCEVIML